MLLGARLPLTPPPSCPRASTSLACGRDRPAGAPRLVCEDTRAGRRGGFPQGERGGGDQGPVARRGAILPVTRVSPRLFCAAVSALSAAWPTGPAIWRASRRGPLPCRAGT